MNLSRARIAFLALALLPLPDALAAADGEIRWNGFLNVVAGALRDSPDDANGPTRHQTYRGYTDQLSFDEQTSAGLQAVKPLDDNTKVTVQLLARGNTNNYASEMRWLYLSWEPRKDDLFRIGRIGTPFYYFSDFLDIGYSYHWVTPPLEVYTLNTTLTGINYLHRDIAEHFEWSLELMVGNEDQFIPDIDPAGAQVSSDNGRMAILEVTHGGWLTLRTMLFRTTSSFGIEGLTADAVLDGAMDSLVEDGTLDRTTAYQTIRPQLAPDALPLISDRIDIEDVDVRYREYAIRAERGALTAMAEWIEFEPHSYLISKNRSWLLTAGWRMGAWTPFITRSRTHWDLPRQAQQDYATSLGSNPSISEQAQYLAAQTTSRLAASIVGEQNETSIGIRYEVSQAAALKIEAGYLESFATVPDETDYIGDNLILRTALNVTF